MAWWNRGREVAELRSQVAELNERAIGSLPWMDANRVPGISFGDGGPAHPSQLAAGVENALCLAPVYAASRVLADGIASLPLQVYINNGDDAARWSGPSVFDKPSAFPNTTIYDWIHQAMTSLALEGNAFGFIATRDGMGFPTTIEWMPPNLVHIDEDENSPVPNPMKVRYYYKGRHIPTEDMLHIRAFTLPGKVRGISPMKAFMLLVSQGLSMQKYGQDWFANGGFPPGVFKNTQQTVDEAQSSAIKGKLVSAIRRHEPLVIGADWDYNVIVVPPEQAQFVASTQMNATQIAAVYGIPAERVGGSRGNALTYCADYATEILTRDGWKTYDQVQQGDTALTLNVGTGLAEWQAVDAVNVFDGPHDVIEMRNKSHSSVTTPNHRWPVWIDTQTVKHGGHEWHYPAHWAIQTTEAMYSTARICAAAPGASPTEAKWSDAMAELVAWFYTEGYVAPSDGVVITQSDAVNPVNVARIRAALTEVFGPAVTTTRGAAVPAWRESYEERGMSRFHLNALAGRQLLDVAPGKVPSTAFLATLTRAQLELFIQTTLDADGNGGGRATLAQKDVHRLEAFQVACALAGRSGNIRPLKSGMFCMSVQNSVWRKPAGHREYVTQTTADGVWCPTTANHTWFARREGTCYFTGNTTVEQNSIELLTETLRPWMVRLECAFFGMLPARRYVRFNADAMIRTDTLTRHQIFQIDREIGMKPVDELRAIDDLEPLPNGAGTDMRPLGVIEQMARTTGVVPENVEGAPTDDVLNPPTAATPTTPAQAKTVGSMSPLVQPSTNGNSASNGKMPSASLDKPPGASQTAPTRSEPKLTPPGKAPKGDGLKPTRSLEDVARAWAEEQMSDHQMGVLRAEAGMFARRGGMEVGKYDEPLLDNGQFAWLLSMCRAAGKPAEYAIIDSSLNGNNPARTGGR